MKGNISFNYDLKLGCNVGCHIFSACVRHVSFMCADDELLVAAEVR